MQNMIAQIVEMDRKAREITEAAQLEKINSEKEVAAKREEIRAEYLARARRRIALNEPAERAAAEADWKKVQQKHAEIAQQLDALYKEKGPEWVNTIYTRVVGE